MIWIIHFVAHFFQRYSFLLVGLFLIACENNQVPAEIQSKLESAEVNNRTSERVRKVSEDTLGARLQSLGLVEVRAYNPKIRVELKYAGRDNFMRENVYGNLQGAYLQEEVASKLARAQDFLTELDSNLYLLVYDAVRPVWVQQKMWDLLDSIPVSRRTKFVSNPKNGSLHNFGAAVDLTLCDVEGNPLDMGAGYDDPSEIAYPSMEFHYLKTGELSREQVANRKLLREVMRKAGFTVLPTEWWHFNAMSREEARARFVIVR